MARNSEPGVPTNKKGGKQVSKWTKYVTTPAEAKISWDELDMLLIGQLVCAVTLDGSAVLLGSTRDGGALVITICAGDERIKFYASEQAEATRLLHQLIDEGTD